jgi:DNA repair exonuclease SbcCD ATPase subunit|tara:strand:- start:145 stop:444 length:300 start_codon:yes stop_codon:yes gene_type:complete
MAEIKQVTEKQVIKFQEEEIKKIHKFRDDYSDVTAKLGELEIELLVLANQNNQLMTYKEELQQTYIKIRESEMTLAADLKEKYGDGEFDINTGIFTPKQ